MANLIDLLKQAISTKQNFTEMVNTSQQNVRVATTAEERSEGLRNQPQGTSMVFPNSTGSFNTKGMKYNIDINKYDNQGHLVQSYESVPPGIENLPMGNKTGTVVETPSEYRYGGKVYQTGGGDTGVAAFDSEGGVVVPEYGGTLPTIDLEGKDPNRTRAWWRRSKDKISDWGHGVLDVAGMVPVLGEIADGANALWYKAEGDDLNAGLSAAGMIPFVGWGATGAKWGLKGKNALKQLDKVKAKIDNKVPNNVKNRDVKLKTDKISDADLKYAQANNVNVKTKQELVDTYNKSNTRYRAFDVDQKILTDPLFIKNAKRNNIDVNDPDALIKFMGSSTAPSTALRTGNRVGMNTLLDPKLNRDFMYSTTKDYKDWALKNYAKGSNKYLAKFPAYGDDVAKLSDIQMINRIKYGPDLRAADLTLNPHLGKTLPTGKLVKNPPGKLMKGDVDISPRTTTFITRPGQMTVPQKNVEILNLKNYPQGSKVYHEFQGGGFVKKFETGGTDESGYMKIFYEEGDKTFESEAKRMTAALNEHYGEGNYEFIPIDLSSHNKETISKNVGSHIQNSSSSTDFTILGHNKSKLNSLFISEELQNKFGKETPDTVDTWSEIFATYKPKNYSGTCYFGSCMMGDEDRLHNFNKTYAQSFTDESGVASKASVGSWTGIKQGIKTDTFDIAFFDPENISGSGGQYISINEEGDSTAYGADYDPDPNNLMSRTLTQEEREQIVLSEIEESSGPPSFGSENTSSTSSAYDADGNYIPQSQRKKHGGVVKFKEEGMRTQAGTLIQKGLNLFRSDDKKVDPYYKDATSFAGEVSGVIGNRKRINLLKNPEWSKNDDSLYTYSNIDDIWNLQEKGYISAETAVWHITEGIEYPRSHYKEEDDIIRNYLHSDKYKERIEIYGNYEDPNETIKLRQEAFEDLTVYHRNNIYYFASEALNRKLEEDNSLSYGDAAYPDATGKFGTVGSNIMYSFISMHPYKREYSSPESEGSYKSTYAHEVGHAIGGRREDSPVELSFNDWLNLAEGNKEFQEAPFTKTQPGTRGITAGGKIRSQKLNYWLETGNYIDEIYEAPYFKKSGWEMDFYYRHTDYRQYNTVQHLTFWGDGPGKFPIYDELNEIEKKWHNTKPGSKERKNIQDQILSMFENIDGSNYDLPNDYPNIEDWRNLAHEEKVALGRTWIAGLNQRHAFNNIRRADESVNPYSVTPPDYLPHYSDDMYQFDVSSIEEYLNNYDFVSRKSKKSAFKKLETLSNKSWERDGVQYLSQRHLDSIIQGISIDEYNSMYKTDNGKELFEADRVALDIFRGKSIELEMDSRKIEGTPTGRQVPEVGMKSVTGSTVHDIGPTEAYSDLTAFRVWVAKDLGIPIEQDWDESTWNYIMREFEKLENKSWENEKGTRDRYLTIKRFIEHFGKEWKGWDKGAAGKHNTIADVDLDLIKNEGDMSNPSTISKTGGFTNYKKGGAVQYQEEGMLDKPSDEESNTKRRDYWLNLNSNKNFVQRILDPSLNIGREVQHPSTGLSMTHYMTSVEVQGQNLVIPQVVDLGEEKLHFFADVNEAIQYALENGEYIITDTKEEAEWLATENYKTKKFKNTYGHGTHKMGGWAHMPKYDTSHQKITKYQEEGVVHTTPNYTGRSITDDEIDKKFLQDLMTKVVEDRKGKGSVENGINKIIDLFNFTARQESFYNPVKNAEGTLPYNDTGIQDDKNNPNPALSMYQWKPQALETTIKRVKNYIGDNFMEQADAYGFIDDEAKAGSKFMPYWFTELQEHKDPRKLSKTQLDILLLLDYAGGNAKLTDYIQGKIDPVDFYLKYHHRGKEGQNPMGIITKDAKEKYNDFLLEKKEGHYDKYNAFKEGGIKK